MFDTWNGIVLGSIVLLGVSMLVMIRVVDWLNASSVGSPEFHTPSAVELIRSEVDQTEKEINDEAARLERRQILREASREASRANSATTSPIANTVSFVDSFPAVADPELEDDPAARLSPLLRNRKAKHDSMSKRTVPDDTSARFVPNVSGSISTISEEETIRLTRQLLTLLTSHASLPSPPYQHEFYSSIIQYASVLVSLPHADLVRYSAHICEQWISAKGFDALRTILQRDSEQGSYDDDRKMLGLTTSEKVEVAQVTQAAETILHTLIPLVWSA